MATRRPPTTREGRLPVISVYRQHDRKEQFDAILREHDHGVFMRSAPLVDEILTDDRIQGVWETRVGGVTSAPVHFEPAGEQRKHRKIAELLQGVGTSDNQGLWPEMCSKPTMADALTWGRFLGYAVAEIVWQRTPKMWIPRLVPFHPQFVRWDWMRRTFVLQTMSGEVVLPRVDESPRGDGRWFQWAPYGVEYGWRRGLLRSLNGKYLSRQWTERDIDRHNERQGLGILKAETPPGSTPDKDDEFFQQLANIGSEAAVLCPKDEEGKGYDVTVTEFVARTWEGMDVRRKSLDTDIAISILGQNLSTEVKEGSRAAAQVHDLIRIDKALSDAEIGAALRAQVLTWFCEFNFGDPELAPTPVYEVAPPDDDLGEAQALLALGQAVQTLIVAEPRVDGVAMLEEAGIPLISEEEMAAREREMAEENEPPPGGDGGDEGGEGDPDKPEEEGKREGLAALGEGVVKRYQFLGFDIAVENPTGTIREWRDGDKLGHTKMCCDYGFLDGYLSADGEELDVYVGGFDGASEVYVIHQMKAPDFRAFDEDKVFLGFPSAGDAKAMFLRHRNDGDRAFGGMSVIPLERFRAKLRRRKPDSTSKIHASQLGQRRKLEDATAMALIALANNRGGRRRTVAGKRRAARYEEKLIGRAQELGARALAPDLVGIQDEIQAASSFEDLRDRILKRFRGMDPGKLAEIIRKTTMMARLSGRLAVVREV